MTFGQEPVDQTRQSQICKFLLQINRPSFQPIFLRLNPVFLQLKTKIESFSKMLQKSFLSSQKFDQRNADALMKPGACTIKLFTAVFNKLGCLQLPVPSTLI
jgi:hypothetical protein